MNREIKSHACPDYKRDGETIQLTIDAGLQQALYEAYAEDKAAP